MYENIVINRKKLNKIRRRKKRKRIVMVLLFVMLICISYIVTNFLIKDDNISLSTSQIRFYINTADEVSKGKLQINWKYLAAIDGVRYKKDFSKANKENLKELCAMFLEKNSTSSKYAEYKLVSIDKVINKLSLSDEEKAYEYLKQLEFIGLVEGNLRKDSSAKIFINELSTKAIELYNKYKILPSITISQAILESGWGKSKLSVEANNLFGIKADRAWKGNHVNMTTSEYYDEVIKANFRRYKNKTDSLDDYGKFLVNNSRYAKNGVFKATQYIEQAQALENAEYSTKQDKNGDNIYADLLIDIIRENDLQLIDNKVQSEK